MNQHFKLLQEMIKQLSFNRKFHICIHDISGIIYHSPVLQLLPNTTTHSREFCNTAKTTPLGMRYCIRCKAFSIRKAIAFKKSYTGQCYLGLSEIVQPVFWNEKPLCIIYIGNMITKTTKKTITGKIKKISRKIHVKEDLLLRSLKTVEEINEETLNEYQNIAKIIEQIILLSTKEFYNIKVRPSLSPVATKTRHWIIEAIINDIAVYYNREISLSDMARLYFVHPNYLCRLFRKETGVNFSEYLNQERIAKAKSLLEHTPEPITNIALQVGFNNVTYFNKLFKKYTGLTPSGYRLSILSPP